MAQTVSSFHDINSPLLDSPTALCFTPPPVAQPVRRLTENLQQPPWRIEDHLVTILTPEEHAAGIQLCTKFIIPGRSTSNLMPLLALTTQRLSAILQILQTTRDWSPETLKAKVLPLVSIATRLRLDPLMIETLRTCASERFRRTPAWLPHQVPIIEKTAPAVLRFAFLTGQRVADMLRLRGDQIHHIRTTNWESIAALITSGKVVQKTGPWTLHLIPKGLAHQILMESWKPPSAYVFFQSPPLTPAQENVVIAKYERELKHHFSHDLRNPRRLGLCIGAMEGLSNAELQTISQHPDPKTLRIYLAAGMLDKQTGLNHHRLQRATELALTTGTLDWSVEPLKASSPPSPTRRLAL